MTVADPRRRLSANRSVKDIEPGDFVRRLGHRGVGFVERLTDNEQAVVAWKDGRRNMLPLATLRRVRAGGHKLDSRRWQP